MSGILDNKSRVIDAILTFEGRRQMADGNFTVKYATFSDASIVYRRGQDGHEDPTNKIYLEAFNAPQDQITFEADDSGNLVPFRQHNSLEVQAVTGSVTSSLAWVSFFGGRLSNKEKKYSLVSTLTGSYIESPITGSFFASKIEGILTSSFDNFKKLQILGSKDALFEDEDFALSLNDLTFVVPENSETAQMRPPTNVNTVDSLFNDEKLRNVDNFLYLPPIKKSNVADKTNIEALRTSNLLLGDYPPWGPIDRLTYADIKKELQNYEGNSRTIFFDPTSRDNELAAQFFEVTNDQVTKLDVIDYGKVTDTSQTGPAATHHIFFVGKVINDDNGSNCFIHLFTLLFDARTDED